MQRVLRVSEEGRTNSSESKPSAGSPLFLSVSPHNYFSLLLLSTFISAFLFYLGWDRTGAFLLASTWIVLPSLAISDRVGFDGKRLFRTGLVPRFWSYVNSTRLRLRITDVEQIETHAVRTLKRGGNVHYRYRTVVRGKGLAVTLSSGGEGYRRIVKRVLAAVPESVLDNRSIELRDYLADPRETLRKAASSRIPSADVLESSIRELRGQGKRAASHPGTDPGSDDRLEDLRDLANKLRVSGYLVQALEAFRRVLIVRQPDARLLFEFARCLHSFAGVQRDPRLQRRALAAIRLSERRAVDDGDLLVRLGEWYFQAGEWRRAGNVFHNVVECIGENFRAARGLAEIALREGKIAHVIHHFAIAGRVAETRSLRRWSQSEAEYFSHLHSNDEYMELEIGRVNLLETLESTKKAVLKIAFFSFPLILAGILFEDALVANIGWAVSAMSLAVWAGCLLGMRFLGQRIPVEMVESED